MLLQRPSTRITHSQDRCQYHTVPEMHPFLGALPMFKVTENQFDKRNGIQS